MGNVLVTQDDDLSSDPQSPCEVWSGGSFCNPRAPWGEKRRRQKSPEAGRVVSLENTAASKEILSQWRLKVGR